MTNYTCALPRAMSRILDPILVAAQGPDMAWAAAHKQRRGRADRLEARLNRERAQMRVALSWTFLFMIFGTMLVTIPIAFRLILGHDVFLMVYPWIVPELVLFAVVSLILSFVEHWREGRLRRIQQPRNRRAQGGRRDAAKPLDFWCALAVGTVVAALAAIAL
jgi:hypothetical protein